MIYDLSLPPHYGNKLSGPQKDYDQAGHEIAWDGKPKLIPPYIPDLKLLNALRYAQILKRPLLLRGEPGSGKSRFAQAVAYQLYEEEYRKYYFEWHVRSDARASDGRYVFDHLGRLRDIQSSSKEENREKPLENYITLGPLGMAFMADRPAVLLIDEVDKADIDFPNDLLHELDQNWFEIGEISEADGKRRRVTAKHPPIIIITSNDERELPNAFLRRCIFHFINLSDDDRKKLRIEIVRAHLATALDGDFEPVIHSLVEKFEMLVAKMTGNANKVPDNSELIDWAKALHYFWLNDKQSVAEVLDKTAPIKFPEILLKNKDDFDRYSK